ncbi:MAG: restriction endonuclease [Clostridium sp.]|nr:restriction endonuclease [Clostridium sp.]MCM1171238.1 restriction endonuclease [Clostridium sp.]MCM1207529.1 restriction endonuclease [Ruminococcus sp.]
MNFNFIDIFNQKIAEKKINWEVSALASANGQIYSLGTDSKLIGRIFELISYSILQEIADENDFILQPSEKQTVYPDFTLMRDKNDKEKIAIDIKTTYRTYTKKGKPNKYGFTLGSYASFMRNGTKNIMFPYEEYAKHYVIGFIYTRNKNAKEGQISHLNQIDQIPVPYKDVELFVQEKYKISGEKPGSGDTENIGSYKTNNIEYLINGEGPFSALGLAEFEKYWAGYPKYRASVKDYTSLEEYFEWCEKNNYNVDSLRRVYEYWKKSHSDE